LRFNKIYIFFQYGICVHNHLKEVNIRSVKMKLNKYRIYDVLHKTAATSLIAFSALGTAWLAYKAVHWYSVRRPIMAAESRRRNEERIAAEQLAHEKELISEKEFKETLRS